MHKAAPKMENCPDAQAVHCVEPLTGAKLPAAQGVHDPKPKPENVPAGQFVQLALEPGENVPDAHGVHDEALEDENVPATHGRHEAMP